MNLTQAELQYSEAKMKDNGSIQSAREIEFAANELLNATKQETINRLAATQKFKDPFSFESVASILGYHEIRGRS